MSLSKTTLTILKNFSEINQGILLCPGNELRTMSIMKNVFASAAIRQSIPFEFAIYDLNEFLAACAQMKHSDGSVELYRSGDSKECIILKNGGEKVIYYASNPAAVVSPGD